uniref:Uncharacterized protein n=1 Tax=Oryza rufipogon TaxID=4529 RepID=A0A0E0N8H6_ORYRU
MVDGWPHEWEMDGSKSRQVWAFHIDGIGLGPIEVAPSPPSLSSALLDSTRLPSAAAAAIFLLHQTTTTTTNNSSSRLPS